MPRLTGAEDLACKHIEGRKEGGGPLSFVVMCQRVASPRPHREPRLGSIQGLDLTLLVRTEDQGYIGRIRIEPHHIGQLLNKLRVSTELERANQMRLKPVGVPPPMDSFGTDPHDRGQRPGRPVGGHS